jgi:hypothetical protein
MTVLDIPTSATSIHSTYIGVLLSIEKRVQISRVRMQGIPYSAR